MVEVTVAQAKAQFSSLLDAVEAAGAEVINCLGKANAALVPRWSVRDLFPSYFAVALLEMRQQNLAWPQLNFLEG